MTMTIDKAIELSEAFTALPFDAYLLDTRDAIKLGNEALKRVKKVRHYKHDLTQVLLPGETKD